MKKSVIHAHAQQIDGPERFAGVARHPDRYIDGDRDGLRAATWRLCRPAVLSGVLRERLFRDLDVDAVFECIAAVGERAFREPWVIESLFWWREIRHGRVHYQWPPRAFSTDAPRREVCAYHDDGTVVLPAVGSLGRRRVVRPRSCPITLTFMPVYYQWTPIPQEEYPQFQADAQRNLDRVGPALAHIGGGAPKRLTRQEATENKKANKLASAHHRRARTYFNRAWQRYEARKAGLMTERGWIETSLLAAAVDNIEAEEFTHGGTAKQLARQWFREAVAHDRETLLSKKILR